ncbi:MAG: TIGR00730 family Rossman fold protein [Elusimicrobia bacterium]|nr:TIGR00730 family Rossman fold protein [Elusimicrobiota bacterium]
MRYKIWLVSLLAGLTASPLEAGPAARTRTNVPKITVVPSAVFTSNLNAPALTGSALVPGTRVAPELAVPQLAPPAIPIAVPQIEPGTQLAPPASILKPQTEAPAAARLAPALGSLEHLAAGLEKAAPEGLSQRFFDQGAGPAAAVESGSPALRLPPGVQSVSVDTVRTAADVMRLIPAQKNSAVLRARLLQNVGEMAPYQVYTYRDSRGGTFTGIDVSGRPELVDRIPNLQSHEIRAIKKLLLLSNDIRVLIEEEGGQTPDLVMGDRLVELKYFTGKDRATLRTRLTSAETQLFAHAQRHGLGSGVAVFELPGDSELTPVQVEQALAGARRRALAQVVFLGPKPGEVNVFNRSSQDLWKKISPARMLSPLREQPTKRSDLTRAQILLRQGNLNQVERHVNRLGLTPGDPHSPASQARHHFQAEQVLRRIDDLVGQSKVETARGIWAKFRKNASVEAVSWIADQVKSLLPRLPIPNTIKRAPAVDTDRIVREIEEPARILREHGIKATVTIYGSARIKTPEAAKEALAAAVRKWGSKPAQEAGRKELAQAKVDLRMSRYHEEARKLGRLVAINGEGKIALVTGGADSGIMQAGNQGAFEAGGPSVGFNIILPKEQGLGRYITPGLSFEFENFPTRKMALRHGAMALVYFPGGFGTMDELFEILTLMQTGKMERRPIVLVGANYWKKILDFQAFSEMGLISPGDLNLIRIVDTAKEAWDVISH